MDTIHWMDTSLAQTSLNSLGEIRLPVLDMTALCLRSIRSMYDTTEKGEELIFTLHNQCHQCPRGALQLPFSCSITSRMGNMNLLRLSLFFGPWKNPPFLSLDIEKDEKIKGKWVRFLLERSLPGDTPLYMPPHHSCTLRTSACSRLSPTNLIFWWGKQKSTPWEKLKLIQVP